MSLYDLMSALHQLPADHPAVLRSVVLERLKGDVRLADIHQSIADLQVLAARMQAMASESGERASTGARDAGPTKVVNT